MKTVSRRFRSPVYRDDSHTYLLVSLISFAGTVILTRLFLEITGYPQLGGGELHIAHVLWGGLVLFIAALLPVMLANRWALPLSALLSGIGVGLFIDEVGKFITQSNDYFFPPAAPIIYAFFLLTVFLYVQIRKKEKTDLRHRLYQVLTDLTEVLEGDLDPIELQRIETNLVEASKDARDKELTSLTSALLLYIRSGLIPIVEPPNNFFQRISERFDKTIDRHINKRIFRILLASALMIAGTLAWLELIVVIQATLTGGSLLEYILQTGFVRGEVRSLPGASWFIVHLVLQGLVGFFSYLASGLLWTRKDEAAVTFGSACMVLSLTAVNLLAFFVDQFSTAAIAIFQLGVLVSLSYYKRRFIPQASD